MQIQTNERNFLSMLKNLSNSILNPLPPLNQEFFRGLILVNFYRMGQPFSEVRSLININDVTDSDHD